MSDDKKELLSQVEGLLSAATGGQNSHNRELINAIEQSPDENWKALGKLMADIVMERAYSPRISGVRWMLFGTALDKNDTEKLAEFDAYYQEGCDHFQKRFGQERLWESVNKAYDNPEARQTLRDQGIEPTLTTLVLQAFPKLGSRTGDKNE